MAKATRNQLVEHLSTLEQVQGVHADMIEVRARLRRLELAVVELEQDPASLRKEVLRLDHRLDERLAGLDRRLDRRRAGSNG